MGMDPEKKSDASKVLVKLVQKKKMKDNLKLILRPVDVEIVELSSGKMNLHSLSSGNSNNYE